jgi:hypothetical protein
MGHIQPLGCRQDPLAMSARRRGVMRHQRLSGQYAGRGGGLQEGVSVFYDAAS